nr:YbjN domain-containing protein [uncultured Acidocella sp.]
MTALAYANDDDVTNVANPLDLVEQVISANEWIFDRRSESDLAAEAQGKWCDYGLYFCWSDEISVMHVSAAFDMKAPPKQRGALYELLAKANERLWIGHFGMDEETGMPVYRHAMLLRGTPSAASESIEDLIDIAISECERFFPAFQFVIWGGKSADEALEAAMLECVGEA